MYVCVHVCACMHTYTYIYIRTYECMCVCTYVCVCMYVYMYVCVCMYVCMYVFVLCIKELRIVYVWVWSSHTVASFEWVSIHRMSLLTTPFLEAQVVMRAPTSFLKARMR